MFCDRDFFEWSAVVIVPDFMLDESIGSPGLEKGLKNQKKVVASIVLKWKAQNSLIISRPYKQKIFSLSIFITNDCIVFFKILFYIILLFL